MSMSPLLLILANFIVYLSKSAQVVPISGATATLSTDVIYALKSVSSGKYLDGRNANYNNPLLSSPSNPLTYQYVHWKIIKGNQGYVLKSVSSGKYLDGRNANYDNPLLSSPSSPTTYIYSQWRFEEAVGGVNDAYPYVNIKSLSSGKYLDGRNANYNNPVISSPADPANYVYSKWIFIPVGYKINAGISNFDFGDYGKIETMLDSQKSIAFVDKDIITIGEGAVGLTTTGTYGKSIEESFSFGFTETVGVGIETTVSCGVPMLAQGEVTVSASFEFSANQQHTETETTNFAQGYSFTPQSSGLYEVGMTVYETIDAQLPFTAEITITGTDNNGNTLSGQQLKGIIYYTGFECDITRVNTQSIEATISGTLRSTFAVYSESYAKKISEL